MEKIKNIAVVAHDNCKKELLDFIACNYDVLRQHNLIATGTRICSRNWPLNPVQGRARRSTG